MKNNYKITNQNNGKVFYFPCGNEEHLAHCVRMMHMEKYFTSNGCENYKIEELEPLHNAKRYIVKSNTPFRKFYRNEIRVPVMAEDSTSAIEVYKGVLRDFFEYTIKEIEELNYSCFELQE